MTPTRAFLLVAALAVARGGPGAAGQAPPEVFFWKVAGTTLAVPAALAPGLGGAFWNPSQRELEPGAAVLGIEVIETPPEVGLSGVAGAASADAAPLGRLSISYARVWIDDLVRTSTNPLLREGVVEVYVQAIGMGWSRTFADLRLGGVMRLVSSRLDDRSSDGWTFDIGMGYDLGRDLRVAAATQFLRPIGGGNRYAQLHLGAELAAWRGTLARLPAAAVMRLGTASAREEGTDVIAGGALELGGRLSIDMAAANEGSRGERDWRLKLGLAARIGRYQVSASRAAGIGGLGAAYRVGLTVTLR